VLEEGVALRRADIDTVYVSGYGFPAYRGGPMFYADRVGLSKIPRPHRRIPSRARSAVGDRRRCSLASRVKARASATGTPHGAAGDDEGVTLETDTRRIRPVRLGVTTPTVRRGADGVVYLNVEPATRRISDPHHRLP
jgi:hypothetical protein